MRTEWTINRLAVPVTACENCGVVLFRQPQLHDQFGACDNCKMIIPTGKQIRIRWAASGLWNAG